MTAGYWWSLWETSRNSNSKVLFQPTDSVPVPVDATCSDCKLSTLHFAYIRAPMTSEKKVTFFISAPGSAWKLVLALGSHYRWDAGPLCIMTSGFLRRLQSEYTNGGWWWLRFESEMSGCISVKTASFNTFTAAPPVEPCLTAIMRAIWGALNSESRPCLLYQPVGVQVKVQSTRRCWTTPPPPPSLTARARSKMAELCKSGWGSRRRDFQP